MRTWPVTVVPPEWLIGILATAAAVAACGGSGGSTEVRPFSEVQADEFVFESDPTTPDRGIFRVTTTEPMICAIVWGESEELGNFNNSLAMNGTGIVDHDVFLPGAEPGETYFFRVQGSTTDGMLFQSELATFTLPNASMHPTKPRQPTAVRTSHSMAPSPRSARSSTSASLL